MKASSRRNQVPFEPKWIPALIDKSDLSREFNSIFWSADATKRMQPSTSAARPLWSRPTKPISEPRETQNRISTSSAPLSSIDLSRREPMRWLLKTIMPPFPTRLTWKIFYRCSRMVQGPDDYFQKQQVHACDQVLSEADYCAADLSRQSCQGRLYSYGRHHPLKHARTKGRLEIQRSQIQK